jgi:alpha-D-xyloside xylohydrolase
MDSKITAVAPGIFRVRLGTPEPLTPLSFRSAPPRTDALALMPAVDAPPIDPEKIGFKSSARGCTVTIPSAHGEKRYGLGLNTAVFELTGRVAVVVPSDHPEQPTNESHAPVPFYVTTGGYGVFIDTARFAAFYFGALDPVSDSPAGNDAKSPAVAATTTAELYTNHRPSHGDVVIDIPAAHGVDVYLIAGPTMLDAVRRYNLFAGGGCVPPLWGLGIAYRGKSSLTADQSVSLAKSVRAERMPCDQWGVEPGWLSHSYSTSLVWSADRFPDPDAFIRSMHEMGFRLNFWEHMFVHPSSPVHEKLRPMSGDFKVWGGLVPDLALPAARAVFQELHEQVLFGKGADAVKLDECDFQPFRGTDVWSFPPCSAFPSGLDGEQMHSLIGILCQQTLLEPLTRRGLRTWGLTRNSHALASPLPSVLYSDSYDHPSYIRGLCKCGFGGLLWSPEVRDAGSVAELYRRIQTVIFSPYAMINCWYMQEPPWRQIDKDQNNAGHWMSDHERTADAVRELFRFRMSLVPYLYSAFNEYRLTGTPPMRAMVLDYPSDPKTASIDDQFLVGPSLLVAPMLTGKQGRNVYLPAGDWYDFWTGRRLDGGREIAVTQPIERVPVFVRGDSLLPLAEPVDHIAADTRFELTVRVYGENPRPFVLYEDDGVSTGYLAGAQNRIELSWSKGTGSRKSTGAYHGPERYRVGEWKLVVEAG